MALAHFLYLAILWHLCVLSLITAAYAWRMRREIPPARVLAAGLLLSALLLPNYLIVNLLKDADKAFLFARLRFVCFAFIAPLFLIFALEYTESSWGRRRRWPWFVIPVITGIVVCLDRREGGVFFGSWDITYNQDFPVEKRQFVGWAWVHLSYTNGLLLLAYSLIVHHLRQKESPYHDQSAWLRGGLSVSIAVAILAVLPIPALSNFPVLTPFSIGLAQATFAWAIFRQRMLNALPVAFTVLWGNMNDAALVLDKNLVITGVNPSAEKLLGQDRRMLIGRSYDDLPGLGCSLLPGQATLTIGERVFDTNQSPLTVRGRPAYGYLVTLRDITAHKLAEKHGLELAIERERSHLLSSFVQNAGHEFRTPLAVIQSSLYLLGKVQDSESQAKYHQRIQEQVDRIMSLVNSLTQIARLDHVSQLALKPTNVSTLIEIVAERWRTPMQEKQVEFRLNLTPALILPLAEEEFVLALNHLIDNALRHTSSAGQVMIVTGRQDSRAYVEVSDTGEGIEPEILPHIFQRLYRADEARTLPGFGLGLPIVQRIVDLHHGVIEAESRVGEGSRFRIYLPSGSPETGEGVLPRQEASGRNGSVSKQGQNHSS